MLKELFEGNNLRFRDNVKSRLYEIMEEKLAEFKKLIAARYFSEEPEVNEAYNDTSPHFKHGQKVKVKETGKIVSVGNQVHFGYYSTHDENGKSVGTKHHTELDGPKLREEAGKIDDQEEQLEVLKQGDTDPKKKV